MVIAKLLAFWTPFAHAFATGKTVEDPATCTRISRFLGALAKFAKALRHVCSTPLHLDFRLAGHISEEQYAEPRMHQHHGGRAVEKRPHSVRRMSAS